MGVQACLTTELDDATMNRKVHARDSSGVYQKLCYFEQIARRGGRVRILAAGPSRKSLLGGRAMLEEKGW